MSTKVLNPEMDGINHINIYSKAKTEIGKILSNFYHFEFQSPDGIFQSIEGYWHYLNITPDNYEREKLKFLFGYEAKKVGEELRKAGSKKDSDFETKISDAIFKKFINYKDIFLKNKSTIFLPFEHYMVFNHGIVDLNIKTKYKWFIDNIDSIRLQIIDKYM